MDEYSKKNYQKNSNLLVNNFFKIGNVNISKNEKFQKLDNPSILCFDYAIRSINEQMFDVNFINIISFYRDIISLSKIFKKEEFIIKSKYDLSENKQLVSILSEIQENNNIVIYNHQLNSNINNLINNSKLIITKPSSTIDHALSYNKKVIVHDYESNFQSLMNKYIDYGVTLKFANSFKELRYLVKSSLKEDKRLLKNSDKKFYFNNNEMSDNLNTILRDIKAKL